MCVRDVHHDDDENYSSQQIAIKLCFELQLVDTFASSSQHFTLCCVAISLTLLIFLPLFSYERLFHLPQ